MQTIWIAYVPCDKKCICAIIVSVVCWRLIHCLRDQGLLSLKIITPKHPKISVEEIIFCFGFNDWFEPKFCTCHDSIAVMACGQFGLKLIINFQVSAKCYFDKFTFCVCECFDEMVARKCVCKRALQCHRTWECACITNIGFVSVP